MCVSFMMSTLPSVIPEHSSSALQKSITMDLVCTKIVFAFYISCNSKWSILHKKKDCYTDHMWQSSSSVNSTLEFYVFSFSANIWRPICWICILMAESVHILFQQSQYNTQRSALLVTGFLKGVTINSLKGTLLCHKIYFSNGHKWWAGSWNMCSKQAV